MASIIAKNNSKVLNCEKRTSTESCNCRIKADCPMPGKCLVGSLVYQATVETENTSETYVGLTANTFKARFGGHKSSFKHLNKKKETTLSKHIWDLKEKDEPYTLSWKILSKAQPFSQVTGLCQLYTREK